MSRSLSSGARSRDPLAHAGYSLYQSDPDGAKSSLSALFAEDGTGAERSSRLSVAFTKEDSAETASETLLPDRAISPHPNLVTEAGLKALELQLQQARAAYEAAGTIEDVNERRRQAATPLRDARYFAARVRTAQLVPAPVSVDTVCFGSTVTFSRNDGRVQTYRIVGEDEADPKAGSISFVSPVTRLLIGKAVGDVVGAGAQELAIIAIS
jgi:transcription elongation GreA/GreB family factor